MTLVPDDRTKGKLKISNSMKCIATMKGLESSSRIKQGDVIAVFEEVLATNDSLTKSGSKLK